MVQSTSTAATSENKLGVKPVPGLVISMAIPFMMSLLVQALYNLVDSIYVARLSEDALTATSLSYPIQMLMIAISLGYAVGINALISRKLGAGEKEAVSHIATTGLVMTAISAAVFMAGGAFFLDPIVRLLTTSESIAPLVRDYLQICMIGSLGVFAHVVVLRFMQASGKMGLSMIPLFLSSFLNIVLDPIMIFGYLGCPAMGIRGAAIATVISQWFCLVVGLIMNKKLNPEVQLQIRGYRLKWETCLMILKIGIPTSLTHGMQSIVNFFMNGLLITISPTAVAFFGIYYKMQNFLTMPMSGLGQASIPIIGFNLGAKNSSRIRATFKMVLLSALTVAVVSTCVLQLLPTQLLGMFHASEELLGIGIPAIRIISRTLCCTAVTMVLGFMVSGLGNAIVNMVGNGCRELLFLIPCAWFLLRTGGMDKIWYAFNIAEVLGCLVTIIMALIVTRKKLAVLESTEEVK